MAYSYKTQQLLTTQCLLKISCVLISVYFVLSSAETKNASPQISSWYFWLVFSDGF